MQRLRRRRLMPAALALAIAAAGAPFASGAAAAAGPYDGRTVIDQGHVDVFYVTLEGGEAVLQVHDDTKPTGAVSRPAEDVVFHVRPSVDGRTASATIANGIPGFTNVGDTIYVLPQNNTLGRIFPGFGYDIPEARTTSVITYDLVSMDGPGNFATWQAGEEGLIPFLNSTEAGTSFTSQANHEHTAWGFTAEGEYRLTMTATVQLPDGSPPITSAPAVYTFYVGEELPGDGPAPEVDLAVTGAAAHYHTGEVATLTAVQTPPSGEDHYHWFTRAPGETDWTVVPDAAAETYGFVVRGADDGTEVIARLYDHDHGLLAESAPVTIHVDDHGNPPVEGPVVSATLEEDTGSLVISVDEANRDVQLSDLALNGDADRYVATGEAGGIRVTDTRSADPGWTANGRLRTFTTVAGDEIAGNNLGWTPKVLETSTGQTVSPGPAVQPALSGGSGIGNWSALGSAQAGSGRGTAVLGADLRLEAPPTLNPGTYQGLLILTVI